MNIEEILNKVYTSDLLSSEELHELTEWIRGPKERIDKAIQFIGNPLDNYWELEAEYLLNILQGVDKE